MKCPNCGYTRGYEWNGNNYVEADDGEGNFFTVSNNIIAQRDTHYGKLETRDLFACPQCRIVFIGE